TWKDVGKRRLLGEILWAQSSGSPGLVQKYHFWGLWCSGNVDSTFVLWEVHGGEPGGMDSFVNIPEVLEFGE
ncbi:43005_t:CDS:2, partial [Gigaspora margarita]